MKRTVRNFIIVLKRFKTSSILNIVGLALAFAVFFVIIVQTRYDLGFDRNFEKVNRIHRISVYLPHRDVRYSQTNTDMPKMIAEKYPEVANYCFISPASKLFDVDDPAGNRHVFDEKQTLVSEGFFDMFKPKILMGDLQQLFVDRNKAMITRSVAAKFFGNEDPLDKTFMFHNSNYIITVVAVCDDFPDNCSMSNGIYRITLEDNPQQWSYQSYIEIIPGGEAKVLDAVNNDESIQKIGADLWTVELTGLADIHLKFPALGKGSFSTTVSLLAIGLLLLVIAYINFVNFSISMAPIRLKNFNIRRIMGENPFFLKFSINMETVLISAIAAIVSLLFIYYFNLSVVNEFFLANISLKHNFELYLLMFGFCLLTGFIAGIYPALYSTAFKPAMALSRTFTLSTGNKMLKNALVVIQFTAAILLIVAAGFIKLQHDYMQDKSWGIRKENVAYIHTGKLHDRRVFESKLRDNPNIIDITYSHFLPGSESTMEWGKEFEGLGISTAVWPVTDNYLRFFGINILEGSDFNESDNNGPGKLIFNRKFIDKYGFTDILGKKMTGLHGLDICTIIGIMEDFNFESLRTAIRPIAFVMGETYSPYLDYMFVKMNGQDIRGTVNAIEDLWPEFSSEPFEISFLNETLNQLYRQENNLAKLITVFGLITIIVTIMGVYGLILFNAKSKRKAIALHKINGASVREVILMLNRGFIIQFVVAYAFAVPLAYIVVRRWLENFAYKTPVYLWVFIAGGLLVFLITALTVSYQSYKAATENPVEGIKTE
ncbi:MAG: hypothetical protein LBL07_11210 [Tannerella sp.]|jgi:putative ABC transport system permease protein|nr:hypothetical protein [Tannerella sp.]